MNFVKNAILKIWILTKMRLWNCDFCEIWDFQNVNFWMNWGFLPQCAWLALAGFFPYTILTTMALFSRIHRSLLICIWCQLTRHFLDWSQIVDGIPKSEANLEKTCRFFFSFPSSIYVRRKLKVVRGVNYIRTYKYVHIGIAGSALDDWWRLLLWNFLCPPPTSLSYII